MKTLVIVKKLILVSLITLFITSCTQSFLEELPFKSQKQSRAVNKLVNKNNQHIKAYAKFVPIREDDFAWENDLVAFRMYGPSSLATHTQAASGIDCWLKEVNYSIIDKWYDNYQQDISYHKNWGEGYDPYHTGTSRGTGGTAIWIDGKAYPASTFTTWRIIDSSREKVIFELDYQWQTPLGNISETKKISLALGSQLFQVTSTFLLNDKIANNLPIAIGITTHDEAAKMSKNEHQGWISAWENINGDNLGTGAVIAPEKVDNIIHQIAVEKDQSHIWLISHTDEKGKLYYAAGYGWERAKKITTESQWHQYLNNYTFK